MVMRLGSHRKILRTASLLADPWPCSYMPFAGGDHCESGSIYMNLGDTSGHGRRLGMILIHCRSNFDVQSIYLHNSSLY